MQAKKVRLCTKKCQEVFAIVREQQPGSPAINNFIRHHVDCSRYTERFQLFLQTVGCLIPLKPPAAPNNISHFFSAVQCGHNTGGCSAGVGHMFWANGKSQCFAVWMPSSRDRIWIIWQKAKVGKKLMPAFMWVPLFLMPPWSRATYRGGHIVEPPSSHGFSILLL